MKNKLLILLLAIGLISQSGCKKYLDVNSDPDTPQQPSNSAVLPPILANMGYGMQRDARYIAKFGQHWVSSAVNDVYDQHGYTFIDNNMGDLWWMAYYQFGNNVNYIIQNGYKLNQMDFVGVAKILQAWSFQSLTDEHDYAILNAWEEGRVYFTYDSASKIYEHVERLCRESINAIDSAMAFPASNSNRLANGDMIYGGDLAKWKRFAYGLLARNYNHRSNKSTYSADSVIKFASLSMAAATDDFMVPFDATVNDNSNFFGTFRNNMGAFRQSNFIVQLLDGTILSGNSNMASRDPRLPVMLAASQDTTNGNGGFRGVNPGAGDPNVGLTGTYAVGSTNWINARKRVAVLWGDSIYANPSSASFGGAAGKYLFANKAPMPVMTSAEILFILAEAQYRKGQKAQAWDSYKKGINLHFDMINRNYSALRGAASLTPVTISDTRRNAYLAGTNVKQDPNSMHMDDILLQKYIAMWGWGILESWVDLRRFSYTRIDPETGAQFYRGFTLPPTFVGSNGGRPSLRVRPNYRSENSYNFAELDRIGAPRLTWHVEDFWPSRP